MPATAKKPAYKIPSHLMVEGIREIDQHAIVNQSQLLLPDEFDQKTHSAKWAFVGASADKARLPQHLAPGYIVDGWEIWKDGKGQPCIRPLGKQQAILMFRPKTLQKAVNAVYGNISRERTIAEQEGRTVQGQFVQQGMLTDEVLRRCDPSGNAESSVARYKFNEIPAAAAPSAGRSSRVRTRKST